MVIIGATSVDAHSAAVRSDARRYGNERVGWRGSTSGGLEAMVMAMVILSVELSQEGEFKFQIQARMEILH